MALCNSPTFYITVYQSCVPTSSTKILKRSYLILAKIHNLFLKDLLYGHERTPVTRVTELANPTWRPALLCPEPMPAVQLKAVIAGCGPLDSPSFHFPTG